MASVIKTGEKYLSFWFKGLLNLIFFPMILTILNPSKNE